MHKKFKKIAAGLLTAAMITPTTAGITYPQNTSAYELLGESTFDYKILPWHTVEASPARQTFDIDDGAAHIMIQDPSGADREKWDLQFRHRNLSFKAGHEYKVSFKAKSKREGMELTSKIGNIRQDQEYFELDGKTNDMHMGPDMGGNWPSAAVKLTNEWQSFEGIFKPIMDIEAAEWTFQYANGTKYAGDAQMGDEIWFDDMSIYDLTDDETGPPVLDYGYTARGFSGLEKNFISVNQLGYYQGLAKKATLGDNKGDFTHGAKTIELKDSYDYEIVRVSDEKVVYNGKTDNPEMDHDSGDNVCKIDFTEFDEAGEYYIRIKGEEWRSFPFRIGNDIYGTGKQDILADALNYFYQNRSGTEIEEKYITSGDKSTLAHDCNRDESVGIVQSKWQSVRYGNVNYVKNLGSSEINTSGGWFTGNEYDKSMTEGGIALWTLQNMYERAIQTEEGAKKFADGSDKASVPESGNKVPDILDECRYELDFMANMKVKSDEKTWGEYAGMYYNGMYGVGFEPYPKNYEHEYHAAYSVEPPTFAATLNYAACAAQGARLWAKYDKEYAQQLLTGAMEAYEAYKKNWYRASVDEEHYAKTLYEPQYRMEGNDFDPEAEVKAAAYWAACELFISAKEMNGENADDYLKDISDYSSAFTFTERILGSDNEVCRGSFTLFNHGNSAAAGSMSLMLNKELLSDENVKTLEDSLLETADSYIKASEKQGYGITYKYDGSFDYVTGLAYPVRFSGFEQDSNFRALNNLLAMAYAYDLTGEMKYINGITGGMDYLLGNNPLAYSFITGYGSYYAENPSHRFWREEMDHTLPSAPDGVLVNGPTYVFDDPYTRALGMSVTDSCDLSERYYADSVEAWSTNETSVGGNASLAWIVSFIQDEASAVKPAKPASGDVNMDGEFNISDIVLLQKWLLGAHDNELKNWQEADFCRDNRLDIFDLCYMRKELLKKM